MKNKIENWCTITYTSKNSGFDPTVGFFDSGTDPTSSTNVWLSSYKTPTTIYYKFI